MASREEKDSAPSFRAGDVIADRYTYVRPLGSGGMGNLHLAIARGPSGFAKQVVLKMPHVVGEATPEERESMLREARVAARLEHPNIVQTFEVLETEEFPIIVMECLKGRTLSSLHPYDSSSSAPRLPLPGALRVISDILQALRYVHRLRDFDGRRLGLVHRDVSPQNIFITEEGQVKLLDFGAATVSKDRREASAGAGKLRYMPREQLLGEGVDGRADLYAVGVLIWEAVGCRRLWGERDQNAVKARLLLGKGPPIDEAKLSAEFQPIVERALADRERRYESADDLDRALLLAAGGETALWTRSALRSWMLQHAEPPVEAEEPESRSSSDMAPLEEEQSAEADTEIAVRKLAVFPTTRRPAGDDSRTERIDSDALYALSRRDSSGVGVRDVSSTPPQGRSRALWVGGIVFLLGVAFMGWRSSRTPPEAETRHVRPVDAPPPFARAGVHSSTSDGPNELVPAQSVEASAQRERNGRAIERARTPLPAVTSSAGRQRRSDPRPGAQGSEHSALVSKPVAVPLPDAGRSAIAACAYVDDQGIKRWDSECVLKSRAR